MLALFLVCFGLSKDENTTQPLDALYVEKTKPNPQTTYPRMMLSDCSCKEPASQLESSMKSATDFLYDGASAESFDHFIEGPRISPQEEISYEETKDEMNTHGEANQDEENHDETQEIQVIKVESILYGELKLSTANLLVIFESNGRKEAQWFKYAQFARLDGAQQAVERFNPTWK
ncbi:hypothetical protein N7476_000341 [Penicillium atrosanguineum]|uniref:Uncharacterized protein n=1 Tax=Penicillium atrosanguineum TaxID=1132637 RepID=A0A9W9UC18_9EURO|nr:hypothetical protein N7476_000341 [Penicillium atrosanguineum]